MKNLSSVREFLSIVREFLSVSVVLLSVVSLPSGSYGQSEGPPSMGRELPIVGGQLETKWRGVGALTQMTPGMGFMGSFCSGTLLSPRWVLTAAHCVTQTQPGRPAPVPRLVNFLVGHDARIGSFGDPPEGSRLYQAAAFYVYPGYDPEENNDDIALLYLSDPVLGFPTHVPSDHPLDNSCIGESVFYVGFGVTSGDDQMGGGQKRSVSVPIIGLDDTTFRSSAPGVGVCFGDSGGPGFLQFDGQWRIVGVNSMVWGSMDDPCSGTSIQVRTDVYIDWIREVTEGDQPDCREDPELCLCDVGCHGETGLCDNAPCTTRSCDRIHRCLRRCAEDDGTCRAVCYTQGSEDGRRKLHALTWCSFVLCGGRSGEDLDACRKVQCPVEYSECFPVMQEGTADCRTVLQCAESCSRFDDDCLHGCFLSGTADAQQAFDVLRDCAEFQCGLPVALSPEPSCLWDRCVIPLAQCAPASFCRPSGGDCAEGFACVPDPMGQFDCFPSTDVPEDGVCQPGKGIACADGTVCMQQAGDEGFRCRRVCSWKGDCPALHECVGEAYEGVANVGTCACKDEDGDGVCVFDDCDDTRSEVYPGAEEICGNSLDDNCDGDTDEGCPGGGDDVHGDQDSAGSGGGSSTSGGRSGGSCSHFPRDGGSAPWWLLVVFMLVALRLRGRASGGPRGNELEGETC